MIRYLISDALFYLSLYIFRSIVISLLCRERLERDRSSEEMRQRRRKDPFRKCSMSQATVGALSCVVGATEWSQAVEVASSSSHLRKICVMLATQSK